MASFHSTKLNAIQQMAAANTLVAGDFYMATDTGDLYIACENQDSKVGYSLLTGIISSGLVGIPGAAGAPGATGPAGAPGAAELSLLTDANTVGSL